MPFDDEFRNELVDIIKERVELLTKSNTGSAKSNIELVIAGIPYPIENNVEFFLGHEVGYLRGLLTTGFVLKQNREMNIYELLEMDKLINIHAFSKLKVLMTGI